MFHFPGDTHAGTIANNTQNLDIAPTILDYLGIDPPDWMNGQSLLKGEPPASRPIFSAAPSYRYHNDEGRLQMNLSQLKPPFYQFGEIGMVICQKYYAFDTAAHTWQETDIQGYPTPCAANSLPSNQQAEEIMLKQLKRDGFAIMSIP